MQKLIAWCKDNIFMILTLFLLAFIPLYPKLPLINVIRTWVYIRLEDFFIAIAALVIFFKFLRDRRVPDTPLTIPIITYWIVGGISLINALIFIFPHITGLFPHLGFLHWARRIEYMLLFFLAFEAYRKKPTFTPVIVTLALTFFGVVLYGFGQKFLGFPAFLTMNEQFAKGVPLRLPSNARFPSTFGGHYDLAAFLVLTIPIMGSMIFGSKKLWQQVAFSVLTFCGLISLLFTASRVSFIVYLIVMSVMLFWHKKSILIVPMIIVSILILNFTSGASERFYKTFRVDNVVVDLSTGKPIGTVDSIENNSATLATSENPAKENLPTGSEYIGLSGTGSDQIASVAYTTKNITGATGDVATVSGSFLIQKALVYDISITTRLQAEWPMAITAFKRNILLGSGYSSLSVATDGDYHRMLGETGILGTIAFLGVLAYSFLLFFSRRSLLHPAEKAFVIGVYAGIVGLAINAVLIDVFEASKVAEILWLLLGVTIAMLVTKEPFKENYFLYLKRLFTHKIAYAIYLILAVFLVWGKIFSLYFVADDFTWLRWAAQSNIHSLFQYFTNSSGFFYRPIPKVAYFLMFSIFWLKPFAYHLFSIVLHSAIVFLIYYILRKQSVSRFLSWAGALLFGVLSIHHENIYWISGQSSLLAAFFLAFALALTVDLPINSYRRIISIVLSYLSVFAAMLSYDGMLVAPLILAVALWGKVANRRWAWGYLLLMPIYWLLRQHAGALAPAGDYGYKSSTVLVNAVGNGVGYTIAIFSGPSFISTWTAVRTSLRAHLQTLSIITGIVVVTVGALLWKLKRLLRPFVTAGIWLVCYLISLAAYAPLGGMAERYAYIPSIFLILAIVHFVQGLLAKRNSLGVKVIAVVLGAVLIFVNVRQVLRVGDDWEKASTIVENSLQVIKKTAFPPMNVLHFYIINMPIRFGRAWVFPTGMSDALWQIYRENPYDVTPANSIGEAFKANIPGGDRRVYIFDHYQLKEAFENITAKKSK